MTTIRTSRKKAAARGKPAAAAKKKAGEKTRDRKKRAERARAARSVVSGAGEPSSGRGRSPARAARTRATGHGPTGGPRGTREARPAARPKGRFVPGRRRDLPETATRPAYKRVPALLAGLEEAYPAAECALRHDDAYQLIVATILSAQCTDERVNKVTPDLFRRYPTPADLAGADTEELEDLIRSTGFFHNKARNLIGMAQGVVTRHGGRVPRTMEELLELPGVARKTANVVLGTAYGIASGVVVDTHVGRISQRLGLTRHEDPVRIEEDLMRLLPRDTWIHFSHQVILHGRQVCVARGPRCGACVLRVWCPSAVRD